MSNNDIAEQWKNKKQFNRSGNIPTSIISNMLFNTNYSFHSRIHLSIYGLKVLSTKKKFK